MPNELIIFAALMLGIGVGAILLLLAASALEWLISK